MKRINKKQARNLYNKGVTIYLIPCNALFGSMWLTLWSCQIKKETDPERTFDQHVNEFEYYNCDYERGYYSHYYVKG